ncbi:uncharacterized protein LOC117117810 [Anneissia japonica]|uniref:uncharacterized protein LOC117117810 n=1 Tax=Anneissia japonica TaxID=1529436 RepID=UPI001425A109|nr:uncharacterized protein LOC117117810 [Anneissia japonica]
MKGESIMDNSLRIWDYGGQLIYHSIHRLYITPESIFVIVFNMVDNLDEYAQVVDSYGKKRTCYMTNLEYLLYFIRSAYTYTKDKACVTDPNIKFPVFIIVGTHCKSLTEIEVKEKLDKIRRAIGNQVYKTHVYEKYFAVENKLSASDENIVQIKKVILEMKEKMRRPIPLKWLNLLIAIQNLSEVTLPLEQVKSMAREYGISDEHIDVAITYLSDVGEIMYHPMEEALKNLVVIQPMEIVKYFRTVFTIQEEQQWKPKLSDHWKRLKKGVLTKRLLKHLWEEFPILNDDTMFNFFVNLMNKFGLICQKKKQNTDSDGIAYYALSHLQPKQYSDPKDDQEDDKVSIFHDFCGFLPDHLFHLAVTKFIEEFEVENENDSELAYDHAEFSIDDHHYVRIAVATINHRRMFKTTVVRRQELEASCVMEPEPATCKKVLSFLQNVLKNLCLPARGIHCNMCIRCSYSEKCQGMPDVKHFNKDMVRCGKHMTNIKRYCKLFGDVTAKVVGSSGGDLEFEEIKLHIPTGAIAEGEHVDILLGQLNPTDECEVPFASNLESRISPIVSCGPSGTTFNKHCKLSFPHNAINKESWEFTVYVNENVCDDWKRIECDDQNTKVSILDGQCCVETNHFSRFFLTGKIQILFHCKKELQLGLYGRMFNDGCYILKLRVWSKHDYKVMTVVKLLYSTRFIHTICKYLQTIVYPLLM